MDHELLMKNAVSTVRAIKTFGVPVVHSTVNVANGQVSLACELQRDWARQETVPAIVEIVLTDRLLKE
jgi:hypothetical protein